MEPLMVLVSRFHDGSGWLAFCLGHPEFCARGETAGEALYDCLDLIRARVLH